LLASWPQTPHLASGQRGKWLLGLVTFFFVFWAFGIVLALW